MKPLPWRWAFLPALLVCLSACNDSSSGAASSSSTVDLNPAPVQSSSQAFVLHQEIPTAAADVPQAASKRYVLVLGSVANDNQQQ